MIEDHVEHKAHAKAVCFGDHFLTIFHRSEKRIHRPVIGNIISVIVKRRNKEWRRPDVIHPQRFEVRKLLRNAVKISDPVSVGIAEGLYIDLINCAFSKIVHCVLLILSCEIRSAAVGAARIFCGHSSVLACRARFPFASIGQKCSECVHLSGSIHSH